MAFIIWLRNESGNIVMQQAWQLSKILKLLASYHAAAAGWLWRKSKLAAWPSGGWLAGRSPG